MKDTKIEIGTHVYVHLAEHCNEPSSLGWGLIETIFPGGHAFTVIFDNLRTEVISLYEIKKVGIPCLNAQ
jgi:hypothetical protein